MAAHQFCENIVSKHVMMFLTIHVISTHPGEILKTAKRLLPFGSGCSSILNVIVDLETVLLSAMNLLTHWRYIMFVHVLASQLCHAKYPIKYS